MIFDEPFISERLNKLDEFSDAFSIPDWKMKSHQICLLSFDGKTITCAAIGQKGGRKVTLKSEIYFKHLTKFPPVSIKKILEKMGKGVRNYFIKSSRGAGGPIPPRTWSDLKEVIRLLNLEAYDVIKKLQDIIGNADTFDSISEYHEVIVHEKDALGLSLDIFGDKLSLRKRTLPYWNPKTDVAPFLKGIMSSKLTEDTMINHDNKIFGDWDFMGSLPNLSSAIFRKGGETLTVCNTNRTSIEKTLGVDLIYYHHVYKSFVLVQYKRMNPEGDNPNKYIYRPKLDKNYEKELERMNGLEVDYSELLIEQDLNGFRLHETPFYFKLCEPVIFDQLSSDLIRGMYFPISLWKVILDSESIKGPKGGIGISYDRARRWLNNTDFINLVQNGWIGSNPKVSEYICKAIRSLLELDHSVTFAYSNSVK